MLTICISIAKEFFMENIPDIPDIISVKPEISNLEFTNAGGYKAVYKGVLNGVIEAIKVIYLPPDNEIDNRHQVIARVKREIDALKLCTTNHLVKLGQLPLGFVEIKGKDYLIYSEEFIDGNTLKDKIAQNYLPAWRELKTLTSSLMEAIAELDKRSFVHRDIKPGNIIATFNLDRPFILLDLGIAFKMGGTDLTGVGGPPGTLRYVSPELLKPNYKDFLDIRSDIYSAAVTIFEYASGKHPLCKTGDYQQTTIYRILKQQPEKLKKLRPDLPDNFCNLVNRCMKKEPALRFRKPFDILENLETIE